MSADGAAKEAKKGGIAYPSSKYIPEQDELNVGGSMPTIR